MNRKSTALLMLPLALIAACSDKEARQSIGSLSADVQLLKSSIAALKNTELEYGEEKFKLENVTYQFSQDAFSPVLNGRAAVIAENGERLPALARVEVLYQVYASDKALLSRGMVPVSLVNGRGQMDLQVTISAMITDADSVSIQLQPHRWYPVYPASPAP
jgi:hypothetical protein